MKKRKYVAFAACLLSLLLVFGVVFAGCGENGEHTHKLDKTAAVAATCTENGNTEYYKCSECGKYFSDSEGKNEIAENSWVLPATEHKFINGDICECGCTRDTWGFEYELSADGAYYKLIGVGSVIGANVVVSSEYNGKNVLAIADDAFRDYVNLKTIIISDSVVTIGSNAFNNCTSLENIVIGSRVTNIGDSAFENCKALAELEIPDGVVNVGQRLFLGCAALKNVVIGKNVTNIGDDIFEGCSDLESVVLKDGFKAVVDKMFEDCVNLKNVTLSNGLQSIWNNAFDGCIGLTAIEIPDSVKSVGQYAFSECTALGTCAERGRRYRIRA